MLMESVEEDVEMSSIPKDNYIEKRCVNPRMICIRNIVRDSKRREVYEWWKKHW